MEQPSDVSPVAPEQAPTDSYTPKMFSWRGRIGRLRYLAYSSAAFILVFCYGAFSIYHALDAVGGGVGDEGQLMLGTFGIVFFLLQTGSQVLFAWRRFEDTGNSGWLGLLAAVPAVSLLVSLYLAFCPGTAGRNQYGPAPAANTPGIVIAGIGLPVALVLAFLGFIGYMLAVVLSGEHWISSYQ